VDLLPPRIAEAIEWKSADGVSRLAILIGAAQVAVFLALLLSGQLSYAIASLVGVLVAGYGVFIARRRQSLRAQGSELSGWQLSVLGLAMMLCVIYILAGIGRVIG
jgi:hypothetical protein